jgi:hypothetical protein
MSTPARWSDTRMRGVKIRFGFDSKRITCHTLSPAHISTLFDKTAPSPNHHKPCNVVSAADQIPPPSRMARRRTLPEDHSPHWNIPHAVSNVNPREAGVCTRLITMGRFEDSGVAYQNLGSSLVMDFSCANIRSSSRSHYLLRIQNSERWKTQSLSAHRTMSFLGM